MASKVCGFVKICSRCTTSLRITTQRFSILAKEEQIVDTRRAKMDLATRRRIGFVTPHQQSIATPHQSTNIVDTIDNIDTQSLPLEIQETISKYKYDSSAIHIATLEKKEKQKTKTKTYPNKLLTEKVSISSSTGYLLQESAILNQLFAQFTDRYKFNPFKIDVSKPHKHSVIISADEKSNITKIRQYILKHIQNKIISIKCDDKKAAIIGTKGLMLKMIKNECNLHYIWEDDNIPGLLHIYDKNLRNGYKARYIIQNILNRTSILSLPIGQYGLLIVDNAYWLDFIREHSNSLIIGLDPKPSEIFKKKQQEIDNINTTGNTTKTTDYNLIKNIIDTTTKSRLLISGDNENITMNATQMLYEFLKDTEEVNIDKNEFGHILGKHKRIIYAMINEVETKFIDCDGYKKYFESEQIEENVKENPFWLEGLRLTVFPIDEAYISCSLWIHGAPFMRNALKYYINSVILNRRKFLFTHANSFWINCLFDYKQECKLIYEMMRKLFGVKMKLVKTQNDIQNINYNNPDAAPQQYLRIYDGETYLLLESNSKDQKLNVNGIRSFLDNLVENSIKMGLGQYSYLFEQNDSFQFWLSLAEDCNVSIIYDKEQNQLLIIGLKTDVVEYQQKLLQTIKKIQKQDITSIDKECLSAQLT